MGRAYARKFSWLILLIIVFATVVISSIFQNRFNLNPAFIGGGGAQVGFSVSYQGFTETASALRQFSAQLNAQTVAKIMYEVFQEGANIAIQNAAVLTGNMRANIFAEQVGDGAAMHSMAPYSGFVDMGTSRQQAQPFFSLGLAYIQQNLPAKIMSALGGMGSGSVALGSGGGAMGMSFSM